MRTFEGDSICACTYQRASRRISSFCRSADAGPWWCLELYLHNNVLQVPMSACSIYGDEVQVNKKGDSIFGLYVRLTLCKPRTVRTMHYSFFTLRSPLIDGEPTQYIHYGQFFEGLQKAWTLHWITQKSKFCGLEFNSKATSPSYPKHPGLKNFNRYWIFQLQIEKM